MKIPRPLWIKSYNLNFISRIKSVTLIELLISLVVVSIIVLSFYSLEEYAHKQVIYSQRRSKVQNELTFALEHMGKYVQQGSGDVSRPAIQIFPPGNPDGFLVWVDFNGTPSDLSDDGRIRYRLQNNELKVSCTNSSCPGSFDETLSTRIANGVVDGVFPDPMLDNPAAGLYVNLIDAGTIEIGLVGRYYPNVPTTSATRLSTNPQVGMKARLICNSCSTN